MALVTDKYFTDTFFPILKTVCEDLDNGVIIKIYNYYRNLYKYEIVITLPDKEFDQSDNEDDNYDVWHNHIIEFIYPFSKHVDEPMLQLIDLLINNSSIRHFNLDDINIFRFSYLCDSNGKIDEYDEKGKVIDELCYSYTVPMILAYEIFLNRCRLPGTAADKSEYALSDWDYKYQEYIEEINIENNDNDLSPWAIDSYLNEHCYHKLRNRFHNRIQMRMIESVSYINALLPNDKCKTCKVAINRYIWKHIDYQEINIHMYPNTLLVWNYQYKGWSKRILNDTTPTFNTNR